MAGKFFSLISLSFLVFLVSVCPVRTAAEDIRSPEELFDKVMDVYMHINNYSYTNCEEGDDTFAKEREKEAKQTIKKDVEKEMNVKIKKMDDEETGDKPVLKKSCYTYKFMKPYLCQMVIVHSDFTPKFMDGAMLTYRPDNDPKVFWAKLKFSPFALKRPITSESGGFLSGNWTMALIVMNHYRQNGVMKLAGREKFDGRDTYLLRFTFLNLDNIKISKVDVDKWQVPREIAFKLKEQLDTLGKEKQSEATYWVDAERFIILKTQNKIAGKVHWTETYEYIKINNLSKEDF